MAVSILVHDCLLWVWRDISSGVLWSAVNSDAVDGVVHCGVVMRRTVCSVVLWCDVLVFDCCQVDCLRLCRHEYRVLACSACVRAIVVVDVSMKKSVYYFFVHV